MKVNRALLEQIRDLDRRLWLCGPDGDPDKVTISEEVGVSFDKMLRAYCADRDIEIPRGCLIGAVTTPLYHHVQEEIAPRETLAWPDRGYQRIVPALTTQGEVRGCLALNECAEIGEWRIVGFFEGAKLSVDPIYQGNGFGRALVATRLLQEGSLPSWGMDAPVFSEAGSLTVMQTFDDLTKVAAHLLDGRDVPQRFVELYGAFEIEADHELAP
jgi:GNAT superfamily N-acetyltransferase